MINIIFQKITIQLFKCSLCKRTSVEITIFFLRTQPFVFPVQLDTRSPSIDKIQYGQEICN